MDFVCKFSKIVCCYNCHYNGIRHDLPFPIKGEELFGDDESSSEKEEGVTSKKTKYVYDKRWMERALLASGTLKRNGSERISKMKVDIPIFGGLLSQIRSVDIEIETADVTSTVKKCGAEEGNGDACAKKIKGRKGMGMRVLTCVAKFSPNELKTRITTDLFGMAETEYAFYDKIAPLCADKCKVRVPRMFYMDINMTTLNYVLVMERLPKSCEFYDQLDPKALSLEDAKLAVKALARFNGTWLGREVLDKNETIFGKLKYSDDKQLRYFGLVAKLAFKKVCNPKQTKNGKRVRWTYKIPEKLKMLLKTSVFKNATKLLLHGAKGPTVGLTHGDPRLENFFFYDEVVGEKMPESTVAKDTKDTATKVKECRPEKRRRVGMVDFQLAMKASILQDLAWFVGTSCSVEFAEKHETALLNAYLDELERVGAIEKSQRPQFSREYRLAFIAVLLKVIIGCDGIDMDVPRSISLSNAHMVRTIAACERHDICTLWTEWIDEYDRKNSTLSSSNTAKIAPTTTGE
eukprot:g4548.t1